MRSTIILAAMVSAIALPTALLAETPALKSGMVVTSSDGKRVGRIYDLDKAKDGTVQSIVVIRDAKIIHIAASTLTASDKGLTTSLTNAEVIKLK